MLCSCFLDILFIKFLLDLGFMYFQQQASMSNIIPKPEQTTFFLNTFQRLSICPNIIKDLFLWSFFLPAHSMHPATTLHHKSFQPNQPQIEIPNQI